MTAARPYERDADHLRDSLRYLDARLLLRVAQVRQIAGGDPARRGLEVEGGDVIRHFERVPGAPVWAQAGIDGELVPLLEEIERSRHELAAREQATRAAGRALRLDTLAERLELDTIDRELLLLALAPELDVHYERLFGWLHDDVTRPRPTVQLALDLLTDSMAGRLALRERLVDPGAPLRRCGAVTLGEPAREGSSARAELVVAAGVTRWLSGGPALAPALGSCVELGAPADVEEIHAAAVARLIDALRGEGRPAFVDLVGPDGVGRLRVALAIAAQLARPCLVVDGAVAARLEAADFTALVEGLTLASRLDRAAICWRAPEALVAAERPDRLAQLARADFDVFFWTWSKMPPVGAWPAALRGRLRAELTPPTEERRVALWSATLPEADAAAIAAVAGAFRMTGGQIREAGAAARALAVGRGVTPTSALLLEVGRQHVAPRLGALASLVVRTSSWDDLVLPPARRQQLEELVRRHRHRATVLSAWGFGRRHADARGLAALFSGASGTGKTMAAAIVARELGRDLYRVDLSQIVSKYIGETEKHLSRIFAEAESSDVALFFDEADALFGKRSAVQSAHDRYANIEVAYLLQRLEAYPGVVILASNLRKNVDDAFLRRLQVIIEFELPTEAERREIWRRVWPDEAPRDPSVDPDELARRFTVSGGHIRNIALGAAFAAAEEEAPISLRHVVESARGEFVRMGKLMMAADFALP